MNKGDKCQYEQQTNKQTNKQTTIRNDARVQLIEEIKYRVEKNIIEKTNADLLIKLITNADDFNEAMQIANLGTMYRNTGLFFNFKLEKMGDAIKYFKKNDELSFKTSDNNLTHKLIMGDNYDALLNLLVQYKNKVDVIYIDPPYGKDSMGEFAKTNYDNSLTRDNLLSMLRPRLFLAKQLFSDEGVIFCSIDDRNQAYVKCLFDDVFGESNFIGNCIRKTATNRAMAKDFNLLHEYLLIYRKNEYGKLIGEKKDISDYQNPDNDRNGSWTSGDPSMKGSKNKFGIVNPYTKKEDFPPKGRGWAFNKNKLKEYIDNGTIIFKKSYNDNERGFIKKQYLKDIKSNNMIVNSLTFIDNKFLNQVATKNDNLFDDDLFDNPKPVSFISKLLSFIDKNNAIILDFFAGSGTTGQAVLELNKEDNGNRQFILVTSNEITDKTPNGIVKDVTSKRLKRVMTGECYDGSNDFKWLEKNEPLGGNLDVYEIDSVFNSEGTKNKTPFDVIDETLYGCETFNDKKDKIEWVCENFEITQKYIDKKN
ncbi:MAG: site-specific DNA-methyltransferase [Bacilli bacterium]|nr:site-specific DNA-methyltransferase [Bacilli bacterium]